MKEEHSFCIGCNSGFYLTDKNSGPTIGSPEFNTLCHKRCCGKDIRCYYCAILIERRKSIQRRAVRSMLNVIVVSIQQMDYDMLEALQSKSRDIGELIGAELDKRDGLIAEYSWILDANNSLKITLSNLVQGIA